MTNEKLYFILSLLGVLILFVLSEFNQPVLTGKINFVNYYSERTIIILNESEREIILFDTAQLFNEGDEIIVYGKTEKYKNKTQIIADKIVLLN